MLSSAQMVLTASRMGIEFHLAKDPDGIRTLSIILPNDREQKYVTMGKLLKANHLNIIAFLSEYVYHD